MLTGEVVSLHLLLAAGALSGLLDSLPVVKDTEYIFSGVRPNRNPALLVVDAGHESAIVPLATGAGLPSFAAEVAELVTTGASW
jgi:hypothetical protein